MASRLLRELLLTAAVPLTHTSFLEVSRQLTVRRQPPQISKRQTLLPPSTRHNPPSPALDEQAQETGGGVTQSTNPQRVRVAALSITEENLEAILSAAPRGISAATGGSNPILATCTAYSKVIAKTIFYLFLHSA